MRSLSAHTCALMSAICVVAVWSAPPAARADDASPLAELVDAAAGRLQIADDVAAVKWRTGAGIEDPARVQQQLSSLASDAAGDHLDPDYVRRIFTDQIQATEAVEYHRFAQWKLDPAAAPATAPDLATSRARIDGFNHVILSQLGLLWQQLHAPACAGHLDQTTRDVGTARDLDEFARRALSSATRGYCAG